MKTSVLPTTLLLLLTTRFSASLPLPPPTPTTDSVLPADCAYHTCYPPHLRPFFENGKPNTPSTQSSEVQPRPHRYHQVASSDTNGLEVSPDSPPTTKTPASRRPPSWRRPSTSSPDYLEYLRPERQWKAAKPSEIKESAGDKALHELPSAALARFWETEHASRRGSHHRPSEGNGRPRNRHGREGTRFYLPGNVYIKSTHYISRRPDIAVVGIVMLFLVLVVAVEAAGTIGAWITRNFCSARETEIEGRRGPIFLPPSSSQSSASKTLLSVRSDPEEEEEKESDHLPIPIPAESKPV